MPTVARSGLGPILLAVQARLADQLGVPSTNIKIWGRSHRKPPAFQSPADVLVRPGPVSPPLGWQAGAGRVATVITRPLQVTPRVLVGFDTSDSDDSRLTDPLGLEALADQVADALLEPWFPTDADGNHLTIEPLLLLPYGEPTDDPEDVIWASDPLTFQLSYMLALTQG